MSCGFNDSNYFKDAFKKPTVFLQGITENQAKHRLMNKLCPNF
nr:hypothetical protein [uncultured Lachnoanaerobaculum sp.]